MRPSHFRAQARSLRNHVSKLFKRNGYVNGVDVIAGNSWGVYNNSIWRAAMSWTMGDGKDQVFVDGQSMNMARWRNSSWTCRVYSAVVDKSDSLIILTLPLFFLTRSKFKTSVRTVREFPNQAQFLSRCRAPRVPGQPSGSANAFGAGCRDSDPMPKWNAPDVLRAL